MSEEAKGKEISEAIKAGLRMENRPKDGANRLTNV
jgi:hypothetical protein